MRVPVRQTLAWGAAGLVVAAVLAVVALHTAWARGRVLGWAAATAARAGLSLHADRLDYNLFTLRATLTGVRLAAAGKEQAPFLTAARVEADLPWSVVGGGFALDHLAIAGGRVAIAIDANGVSNLPASTGGPPPATPRRFELRALDIDTLEVAYVDTPHDVTLTVPGIQVALAPDAGGARGTLRVAGRTRLAVGERAIELDPAETPAAFDGSNVELGGLALRAAEADVRTSGRILRVLDAPAFDLAIDMTPHVEAVARKWIDVPVALGGAPRLSGTLTGPSGDFALALDAAGRLAVGDEKDIDVSGRVQVTPDAAMSDNLMLRPAGGGAVRASFTVPFGDAPMVARADWQGVDAASAQRMAGMHVLPLGASLAGELSFDAGQAPSLTVSNRATPTRGRGLVAVDGRATATLDGDRLAVTHAHDVPGARVEGRAEIRLDTNALGGTLTIDAGDAGAAARDIAALDVDLPALVLDMTGAFQASLQMSGTLDAPAAAGPLTFTAVDVPSLGVVTGRAAVQASTRRVDVDDIDLARGSARLTGRLSADVTRRALDGRFALEADEVADLQSALPDEWRLSGPARAEAVLGGSFDAFHLDAVVDGHALTIADQSVDRLHATARITADDITVASLEATQDAGTLKGRGAYNWATDGYQASAEGQGLRWKATLAGAGETQATVNLTMSGEGTLARPAGQAHADVSLAGGVAGRLVGAGEVDVDVRGGVARVTAHAPLLGALVTAHVDTAAPYAYTAVAALDRMPLGPVAELAGAMADGVIGTTSVTATVNGTLGDDEPPTGHANVQAFAGGVGNVPFSLEAPAQVTLAEGRVSVEGVELAVGQGRLTVSGDWTGTAAGRLKAGFDGRVEDLTRLANAFGAGVTASVAGTVNASIESSGDLPGTTIALTVRDGVAGADDRTPLVRGVEMDARLDRGSLAVTRVAGQLAVDGATGAIAAHADAKVTDLSLSGIEGSLVVDSAALSLSGVPVSPAHPSRLDLSGGTLRFADVAWNIAGSPLTVAGTMDLAGDRTLDVTLKGSADLRALSGFLPPLGFDGRADIDARLSGAAADPLIAGRIVLDDAEVAIPEPRLVVSAISGPILLSGRSLELQGLTGTANGGSVTMSGSVALAGGAISGGALTLNATGVALEIVDGLRSEIDGQVTFNPDPRAPSLTGAIRIDRSAYTKAISIADFARQATMPAAPIVERPYLDRVRLNLTVSTVDDLTVDNNYGRFEAGADLRVLGTVAEPGLTGRISLREAGRVYLAGRSFRLTRGDISFADVRRIRPEFNIAATARVGSDDVTMTLTGTPDSPSVDLTSSNGSKTQSELAADLVGGGTGVAALSLLSSDVLGVTGRAIGLDALRVESGDALDVGFREDPSRVAYEADPSTRLTLAKRISEQVEVTLSQNLRENGKATIIVSYYPIPSVELRGLSRDNNTLGFGVRHQVTFGGGGAAAGRSASAERPVITGVTFVDTPPDAERLARERLSIRAGDRLDFLDLQRGLDAVRDQLQGTGHYEARARVRRRESDGGVALEFTVDPGPATSIVVVGADLSAGQLGELRRAWISSVIDQFLIDDLTALVRQDLVTTGSLASIVVGRVERPAEGQKRVRIDVTPGIPVDGRELRFSGNERLATADLRAAVMAAGLDVQGWVDPPALADLVTRAYRQAGFLEAEVTAGPIGLDGAIGVLPVVVTEGPQARVTSVTWDGVAPERRDAAAKAAALAAPAPYVPNQVEQARVRVERMYRDAGYVDAAVEAVPSVTRQSEVAVAFEVTEGPQQVLQNVEVKGATRTNPGLINGALQLPVGRPVNPDDWAQARKRLYETNVFRLVDIESQPIGEAEGGIQGVRALVSVQEYPAWALRYGVQLEGEPTDTVQQFTSAKNIGLAAELVNQNLLGRAINFGGYGRYEYDFHEARLFASTSRLFGGRARTLVYTFGSRERLRDDQDQLFALTDRAGLSGEQRWKIDGVQVVYGYRFEHNHTFDPEPSPLDPFPLDYRATLGKITTATFWDRRENPLAPRTGTFSSLSWDQAAPWLGSDTSNTKVLFQQFLFLPAGPRVVLATRVEVGKAFGRDELFLDDRFTAGGATTVRGYPEESLGPRDIFGIATGGDSLLVVNQEARVGLYKWINGVVFFDAGQVQERGESFAMDAFKLGYGVGLRLDTPVGLLRVDFGIPGSTLDIPRTRTPNSVGSGRWYFGLGHIF